MDWNTKYESILNKVAIDAGEILKELVITISPLYRDNSPLPYNIHYPLIQLYSSLIETAESLVILISFGRIWDSKLLGRMVAEGALKFLYISKGTDEEMLSKLNEYFNIIPYINRIKIHNTTRNLIDQDGIEPLKQRALQEALLSEEEIIRFKDRHSDKELNRVNKKWSNNGLLQLLKNELDFNLYISLIYDYKLSSHISHLDADLLEQKKEFVDDIDEGLYTKGISLGVSALANVLVIILSCTLRFLHFQGIDPEFYDEILTKYHNMIKKLHEVEARAWETEIEEIYKIVWEFEQNSKAFSS